MGTIGTAQSDLVKKPAVEQAASLAALIRGAWKGHKCANAQVSLEKTYNDRSGGWLVLCDEGRTIGPLCAISQKLSPRSYLAFWRSSRERIVTPTSERYCRAI